MKLLIAVESATSTEVLVGAVGSRPWPEGTTAHVLSVVADATPLQRHPHRADLRTPVGVQRDAVGEGAGLDQRAGGLGEGGHDRSLGAPGSAGSAARW